MGVELELGILLVVAVLGTSVFAVFEVETPPWRKALKWGVFCALTLAAYSRIGHLASIIPVGGALAGLVFHFIWCRRNGIHLWRATPRRRYYELRAWVWPDEGPGSAQR